MDWQRETWRIMKRLIEKSVYSEALQEKIQRTVSLPCGVHFENFMISSYHDWRNRGKLLEAQRFKYMKHIALAVKNVHKWRFSPKARWGWQVLQTSVWIDNERRLITIDQWVFAGYTVHYEDSFVFCWTVYNTFLPFVYSSHFVHEFCNRFLRSAVCCQFVFYSELNYWLNCVLYELTKSFRDGKCEALKQT